ncbi:hypothetical protein [Azospirillum canadense]|uniref:hypothetical protein n=1 Tax=Azospirillum canadense TaxID=403962 RepID=UPI002227CD89|nr:hypothetical protein [Azospirillum canadense]MCW2241598.1 hypothetical protein [Azospirillum canadense]
MFADGNRRPLSPNELEAIKADLADRGAAPNETNITTFSLTADGLADYAEVMAHTLGQILAYEPNSYVGAHVANDSEVADEEELAAAAGAVYVYLKEQGMSAVGAAGPVAVTTAQVALDDGVPPEQMMRIAMEILMGAALRMKGRT